MEGDEEMQKYNQLMGIDEELSERAEYVSPF
jgi:enolase